MHLFASPAGVTGGGPGGLGGTSSAPEDRTTPRKVLVAIVVALNAAVYMYVFGFKPWLQAAGVSCPRHTLTELSDWVMISLVAAASLGLTTQVRRRAHRQSFMRVLLAVALVLSGARAVSLLTVEGLCALLEIAWCGIFICFGLSIHLVGPEMAETQAVNLELAEAEVAKVMAGLSASTWSDEGPDGNLESGNSVACSICLGDWEPRDSVKTTPCHHSFHEDCLQKWLLSSMCKWKAQSCAVCRRDLRCETTIGRRSQPPPVVSADAEEPPSVGDRS